MHRESIDVQQLFQEDGKVAITSKNPKTGEVYLALFNISDSEVPVSVSVDLAELGLDAECTVMDLWSNEDLGTASGTFSQPLAAHASGLFKLSR
jgi:hypothetical protein